MLIPLMKSKPVGHQSHCFALDIFHHCLPKQLSYWISSERDEEKVISFEIPVRCNTLRIFFFFALLMKHLEEVVERNTSPASIFHLF